MLSVLLVEDDLDLAATVVDYLTLKSMQCDHAANGIAGLNLIERNRYDVVLLDINMPAMDGFSVCQTLRGRGVDTPILMLTARDSLEDKIEGFNAGTDDYLVKPFEIEELLVRISALSKRRSGQVSRLNVGSLELDLKQKVATAKGKPIKLTPTSYRMLEALMRSSPEPISRNALLQSVWGEESPSSGSLRVHLHQLRKLLASHQLDCIINTIPGFGFSLTQEESDNA